MNKIPSAAVLRARRVQKKGVKFTILVCGAGGCGKSTFINTLCGRQLVPDSDCDTVEESQAHLERDIELKTYFEEIPDEVNGTLTLKFIESPGFGDALDNSRCFEKISQYVEQQFDDVLAEESRIRRNPRFSDNRVHALVYFIVPTGHGLREMDVEFMKLMAPKVNVIPVIAKADSLTPEELTENKRLIMEDIENYHIPIYQFPTESDLDEDDEEDATDPQSGPSLGSLVPFSVIGGSQTITVKGRSFLARKYPWGYIDVEDQKACDFVILRDVLLYTHVEDLKETTHDYLYETYRTDKLSRDMEGSVPPSNVSSPKSAKYGALQRQATSSSLGESHRSASYVAREENLRQEEDKLRAIELKVQEEIARKRQELIKREQDLRDLERKLQQDLTMSPKPKDNGESATEA